MVVVRRVLRANSARFEVFGNLIAFAPVGEWVNFDARIVLQLRLRSLISTSNSCNHFEPIYFHKSEEVETTWPKGPYGYQ